MNPRLSAYQGDNDYVFVCYAHEDSNHVFAEIERLVELGFNIWYDEGISLGHEWTSEIADAISSAADFLYFVSPASVNSRNCRNEVQFAMSRNKQIISVHLEPTELPGGLELATGLSQAIRRYEVSDEMFFRKLTEVLTAPASPVSPETKTKKKGGRNLKRSGVFLALILLVVSAGALWWMRIPDSSHSEPLQQSNVASEYPSIAVLPFDNLSSDPEQTFFSHGVAEEVLNLIARSPSIKVISRSSSFSFVDQNLALPAIAKKLGVNHILQGSVRKSGDTVRVAVQLVEVQTDSYLWTKSYDREFDNIFAIQDEIAKEVAAALNVVLTGANPRTAPRNAEAYSLYLRARHTLGIGASAADLKVAEDQLKQALALDPEYVAAWRELGRVYLQQVSEGMISGEESTRLRWDTISKALEIDPDDPVSNAYRGYQEFLVNDNLEEGARRFEKAVSLAPRHEDVLRPLIIFMVVLDRVEEALPFAQLSIERDPLCGFCLTNLGSIYRMLGRLVEADQQFLTASTVLKSPSAPIRLRAELALLQGDPESALQLYSQLPQAYAGRHAGTAVALHSLGRVQEFDEKISYLISTWPEHYQLIASVYAGIGDPETAFRWLEDGRIALGGKLPMPAGMPRPSAWAPYSNDPRWQDYLEAIGRSPERLRSIEFNPTPPTSQ